MGVRVLALVVRKRLIGGWEIRRLEIRGWGVRERRSAGVGSLRDGSQLGQPGTVAGHSIMPVLIDIFILDIFNQFPEHDGRLFSRR